MLIGQEGEPFDSDEHLFELKLAGERCLAYLDPAEGTELINKRGVKMLAKVPELSGIHKQEMCIRDRLTLKQIRDMLAFSPQACCEQMEKAILAAQKPHQDNYTAIVLKYHGKEEE